ncbi:MAG: ABC transporter ATP-binding protein [Oscillospiraceae bacterium]
MAVNHPDFIVVSGLTRQFSSAEGTLTALSDVSFTVRKGEMICIVGASGCGKSTLLRAVAGLDPDHEGSVTIDGREIVRPEKNIGIVFQEHRLFPWLTVEKNIGFALNGISREERAERVSKYIHLVGLEGFEKTFPAQLSGGMAQRAGIARALVNEPPVLLLDEPFGALDAFTKITLQNELKRIQKESHTTMLMVTHDIDEAVYLSDRVIVLSSRPGQLREIIPVDLPEPRDRNSMEFLAVRRKVFAQFFSADGDGRL